MTRFNAFDWVALILLIIGGLNWGLVGLFGFNLVAAIVGDMSVLARIIYVLVGIAAVFVAIDAFRWRGQMAGLSERGHVR
ncbi:MAG: DUF378 domain-containing protein [Gammaproteobacteria bacterium]|nr:DUF378 domain-containing protein [Gammaproteobacteria bacterium]